MAEEEKGVVAGLMEEEDEVAEVHGADEALLLLLL